MKVFLKKKRSLVWITFSCIIFSFNISRHCQQMLQSFFSSTLPTVIKTHHKKLSQWSFFKKSLAHLLRVYEMFSTELIFPLVSIIMFAVKPCWGSLLLSDVQQKINCPTVFPLRQCFIGLFLSAESWLPVSERGSKWMAPLMHFILQGVREGGRGRDERMKERAEK